MNHPRAFAVLMGSVAFTGVGLAVAFEHASAWGDGSGRICHQGHVITLPTEMAWEKFLAEHPNARPYADGDVCGDQEVPPSPTNSIPASTSTSTPSVESPPVSSAAPTSTDSAPPTSPTSGPSPTTSSSLSPESTPSSILVTDSAPPTSTSGTWSGPSSSTPAPGSSVAAPPPPLGTSGQPTSGYVAGGALPATGAGDVIFWMAVIAAIVVAAGFIAKRLARRP